MDDMKVNKFYEVVLSQDMIESILKSYILNNSDITVVTDIDFDGLIKGTYYDDDTKTELTAKVRGV
jgi:ribosome-interacting GTPase 1